MDDSSAGAYADLTLNSFTEALASARPVPGGGSASAVAAALAASLLAMVARLSLGRPRYAVHGLTHERALAAGDEARARLLALADDDARAFQQFAAALKLPRDDQAQVAARKAALSTAALDAARVPLEVVRACEALETELESMAGRSNPNASSDLDVGALLCEAAASGAGANVRINLDAIPDSPERGPMLDELEVRLGRIREAAARIHEQVRSGAQREPESA